jgi:hypothetical protein
MSADINAVFNEVLNRDRRLLTVRQQLWIAFRAGAQWAISNVSQEANGGMRLTCPNCGHEPCAEWCSPPETTTALS